MALKFENGMYWNPAEWVSRTLFRSIDKIPTKEISEDEHIIVEQIRKQIKLYVWLLNCEKYSSIEFTLLDSLIDKSKDYEVTTDEYKEVYEKRIKELKLKIAERLNKNPADNNCIDFYSYIYLVIRRNSSRDAAYKEPLYQ